MSVATPDPVRGTWAIRMATAFAGGLTWVTRRRETVVFVEPMSLTRRVEVEFSVPSALTPANEPPAPQWVLIGFVPRVGAGTVRVVDEDGTVMPILTAPEARGWLLEALARYLTTLQAPASALDELSKLADRPGAVRVLTTPTAQPPGTSDVWLTERLRSDRVLGRLLESLADTYPLVVTVYEKTFRRIFTYEHDDTAQETDGRLLFERLGWSETRTAVAVPGLVLASAYELAIEVPDGVVITSTTLQENGKAVPSASAQPPTTRFARVDATGLDAASELTVEVKERAQRGYPVAVFLTAAAMAVVLTGGWLRLRSLAGAPDAASAILLAVPALFSTFVAQPGRGTPGARLISGARAVLVVTGVLAYLAAVMLVFYPESTGRHPHLSTVLHLFWPLDVIAAWLLVLLLAWPLIAPILERRRAMASARSRPGNESVSSSSTQSDQVATTPSSSSGSNASLSAAPPAVSQLLGGAGVSTDTTAAPAGAGSGLAGATDTAGVPAGPDSAPPGATDTAGGPSDPAAGVAGATDTAGVPAGPDSPATGSTDTAGAPTNLVSAIPGPGSTDIENAPSEHDSGAGMAGPSATKENKKRKKWFGVIPGRRL
jgi:hypothetical protein